MEVFFRTHSYLIEHLGSPIHRRLMDEIDWKDRLIAIRGTRGIGKTTFLLQYAKKYSSLDKRDCLYINMNNFLFTIKRLYDFAEEFVFKGGKILLIDQVFKYPNWADELNKCYQDFPTLKIVFTLSSVIDLEKEVEIAPIVKDYTLRGFSFREFLNIMTGSNLKSYTLTEIIHGHQHIAQEICNKVKPLVYFRDYIHHGYYPYFLEKRNFSENLLKTINITLEIDVLSIKQIEQSYLPKLRKLFYLLAIEAPGKPNISQLSIECGTSRATITNYMEYLKVARLINLLYKVDEDQAAKKPHLIYLHNTNLIFAMQPSSTNDSVLQETFLYNQLHHNNCKIRQGFKQGTFIAEDKKNDTYTFKIETSKTKVNKKSHVYHVVEMMEIGEANCIPLWLLGFLY